MLFRSNRPELDKIHEFIEGLRPEFVVPVQSAMPRTAEEAMEKARALETAFSMGMELSAYSMLSGYLQNMNGGMVPAKTNLAMYQPTYTATQQFGEPIEQLVERKIKEGITAALGQIQQNTNVARTDNKGNYTCYKCGKVGHFARDCRQRSFQNNNNNNNYNNNYNNNNGNYNNNNRNNGNNGNNNNRNVECYNCGKKGHISRNCRASQQQNNQGNRQNNNQNYQNNGNRNFGQNNGNNRSLN